MISENTFKEIYLVENQVDDLGNLTSSKITENLISSESFDLERDFKSLEERKKILENIETCKNLLEILAEKDEDEFLCRDFVQEIWRVSERSLTEIFEYYEEIEVGDKKFYI